MRSRSSNKIDVYVRGTTGQVYVKELYQGVWFSSWYSRGGQLAPGTRPAASSTNNRVDVFAQGTNGALYQRTWNSTAGWTSWQNRGGVLTSSPAAAYRPTGFIEVYVRGTNGAVYGWEYYIPSNIAGWYLIGGQVAPGTGPGTSVYGLSSTSRSDVFAQGTNGALYQKTWNATIGWSGWTNLGGTLTASPTAATFTYSGSIDIEVFVRGTTGLIYQKEFRNGGWHGWLPGVQGPS